MNQFDVYGVGNALVDIEYHASASRLRELGIDKGLMTLIDEQRQNSLIAQLGKTHEKMACGGSAANTIIALAQMGAKTHFDCRVANDMTGQFFARDLHRTGVHSSLDYKELPIGHTGKCLVFVTPDADRSMNTFLGAAAELDVSDIDVDAVKRSQYIYIEGYLCCSDNSRDAAVAARLAAEAGATKTALTLSDPNMVKFFRPALEAMIGDQIHLLFANEDEALEMAATDRLEQAVQYFKKLAHRFAITRGKKGALVFDGLTEIEISPRKVKAIDTLGAGDMFASAFLYGLTQGMSYHQCGDFATLAAGKIVTQVGPRLQAEQTRELRDRFCAGI